jgi:hypothetical protein
MHGHCEEGMGGAQVLERWKDFGAQMLERGKDGNSRLL